MTMLLKLAVSNDTVVFSGDKRLSDCSGFGETYVKATRLGTSAVGGACERTCTIHPQTGVVLRDVHEQLRSFFDKREVNDASIKEFEQDLRDVYRKYLDDHRGGKEQPNVDCNLFWVVMTYFFEGRQIDCTIRAHVTTQDGLNAKHSLYVCKKSTLLVYGDDKVKDGLRSFHKSLASLYAHKDIVALLSPPHYLDYGTLSVDQAVEICRLVNKTCSEKATEITGETSTMSPDCDVLDPRQGWRAVRVGLSSYPASVSVAVDRLFPAEDGYRTPLDSRLPNSSELTWRFQIFRKDFDEDQRRLTEIDEPYRLA